MPQPWFMSDTYDHDYPVPIQMERHMGPNGIALVRAWKDGTTDAGWGLQGKDGKPGFMLKYLKGHFRQAPIVFGYERQKHAFAFVMRSMKLVCIDIDGKNGGLQHVGKLGMLPLTLAETSKSGDGYHLFYATTEDEWDEDAGFAEFSDRIALEQGVDLRATGCVYHYPQQRWNGRHIAELPLHLKDRLRAKAQSAAAQVDAIIKVLDSGDTEEVAIMHDALLQDLKKPIPAGRRNTTLFAIGQQMKLAAVPSWQKHVKERALSVGLGGDESDKLVANIEKYS